MPRITRKQQKVFAVDATNNGVFGSLQANDPVHSQDPDVIQSRTAYSNGWNDATYSAEKLPPLEEFQALQYLFSRQLAYLMQDGIAEWDTNTTYYKGALVKAIQSDGSFILYASLVDNNQGNLVTDTTKWVITNTSTNFHQGIPNWRADVIYSEGDWVKSYNSSTGWMIYESVANSNLNNAVTDTDYWSPKPFTSEFPLLMWHWFDHELDDTSWLRADTFSWQSGTVYKNAYDHLVDDIDGKTAQTETVGSYNISYYLADDGHKITTDETTVANIYAESGVAWYYVLDTANQRFKLPRENPAREELIQIIRAKGDGTVLGLNQFDTLSTTGKIRIGSNKLGNPSSGSDYQPAYIQEPNRTTNNESSYGLDTDSTKSGIISDTTESVSIYKGNKYLYFYIGNFSQSATEQTAGLNAELFNGKLDLDAGNATSVTKKAIMSWGIPDYSSGVSVTYPTSSAPFVAPKKGVLVAWISIASSVNRYLYINGVKTTFVINNTSGYQDQSSIYVPLDEDDSVYFDQVSGTTQELAFYPFKGEV